MTNGSFTSQPLMRLTLMFTFFLLLALWVTNAALYLTRMGFDPASVVLHYRGSEEAFINPRTFGSMLEVSHAHLATMTVVVLLLTHLAIFLPWTTRWKAAAIATPFASMFVGEASSWLVRYAGPGFAIVKVIAFLAFQLSLLVLLAALAGMLLRRPDRRAYDSKSSAVAAGIRPSRDSFTQTDSTLERARPCIDTGTS